MGGARRPPGPPRAPPGDGARRSPRPRFRGQDDLVASRSGDTSRQPPGAGSRGSVKGRNEGRDHLKEGNDILKQLAKKSPELQAASYPNHYIRVNAYDPKHGRRTIASQFILDRPKVEPGYRLDRTEWNDRRIRPAFRVSPGAQRPSSRPPSGLSSKRSRSSATSS